MKLTFIGADHEVTGSCHCVEACGKWFLVDCGMEQGTNYFENAKLPVDEACIDYVFLTHAHVDHSGMLPLLYAKGFRGQVFATLASADLCDIMLRDCAHIQTMEAEWKNRKAKRSMPGQLFEPIYTMEDAEGIIKRIVPCHYGQLIEICDGIKVRFTDIGHLLGSASIELWLTEGSVQKKIVFSGDIGNKSQPLLKDPAYTEEADYVVMESTYGDRLHGVERPDYVGELAKVIQETLDKGGNVVIPSFAVGRTQEILYFIRKVKMDGLIKGHDKFPVYVDSPMAVRATSVFQDNKMECFDKEAMELVNKGINPISFPGLKLSITSDESKEINFEDTPKVIISASGMCEAGRIRHHLKHNLWRPDSTVLFAGYQAVGTLGRVILEGAKEVKLFGEPIQIRAKIMQFPGLSGHADKNGLIEWVTAFKEKPRKVFIVHGEDSVCTSFAECLQAEHGLKAYAPYSGTVFNLASGKLEYEAEPIILKKVENAVSGVFARLLSAGQRLLNIIKKNEGCSTKDLAKFADQVTSLCDKWDM
ncbi:MAG TPA: MBL fold metallo-hydrolase [Lachnospiraceae bacterium]|nr:MBL fold metallo-hydrolase [Lachnospiraceae bacterium]